MEKKMEMALDMSMIADANLKISIEKVGYEFCNPRKKMTNCVRPCFALHFVLFGKGVLVDSNGKKYEIGKNDAFLLYQGERYSYFPDDKDPWSYIWVEFGGTGLEEFVSLCGFKKNSIQKHVTDFNEFVMLMRNMHECYDASELQSLRCMAYLMLIFGKFIELESISNIPQRDIRNRKQIRDVLIYINNNCSSSFLTTEMIARSHGMSVRSLNRLFTEVLNMTPIEYLNAYRISVACEGIQLWNPSMAEVAKWAGFEDEAYFSRVFKNMKGMSPQEYKKNGITEDPFAWIKEKGMLFR